MALTANLRHLENEPLELKGEISVAELGLEAVDPLIEMTQALKYRLTAEKFPDGILVQGSLDLPLVCRCGRCLEPFSSGVDLASYALHVPLEGDDRAKVVDDCVDLTPYLREDILLTLPQRPLCKPDCRGLSPRAIRGASGPTGRTAATGSPAWAALNKLKLEND